MKIGVAITVQDRVGVSDITVSRWKALLPKGAALVIVDDASEKPYPQATYRFEKNVGIARAKNKCLELLEDQGVTDFFLSDSDCYPTHKNWWKPYVESPEPHLSYQFLDLKGPGKLRDMMELFRDSEHVAYTGQRGCLLYFHESAIKRVGGFDPIFGRGLYEHSDLANRIHAAGLTTWRYADVTGSAQLWHSMDEQVSVTRTIPTQEQRALIKANVGMHNARRAQDCQAFVPYREEHSSADRDIVITTLLTKFIDPQRGFKWKADPSVLIDWLESLERLGIEGAVIADEVKKLPRGYSAQIAPVEANRVNVYYQRWMHIYQFLRVNEDLRFVWCTDGTDVEVLRDPFDIMLPGRLYVGSEKNVVGSDWMRSNHPAKKFEKLWTELPTHTLLNAGVIGADRETMMEFAHKMVTVYGDIESERFWGRDGSRADLGDMAAFNYVAYKYFNARLIFGPEITTEFKKFEDNGVARFKHK